MICQHKTLSNAWKLKDVDFSEKLSRAQELRKEATRHEMLTLVERVLTDNNLDHQRAAVAGALMFKAEQISAPRQRIEMTGVNGGAIETKDVTNEELARKIAFILHLAAMEKAALIKDAGNGGN